MKENNKIKYPATHIIHCPSGPTHACEEHAKQIQGVMGVLGTHAVCTPSDGKHECSNCKNEANEK